MNPKVKEKWLTALRSGKYKQGENALQRQNEFCCLGVLCDLHAQETRNEWATISDDEEVGKSYLGSSIYLPPEVVEWAGVTSGNPMMEGIKRRLTYINDYMFTFSEIANLIEEEL